MDYLLPNANSAVTQRQQGHFACKQESEDAAGAEGTTSLWLFLFGMAKWES